MRWSMMRAIVARWSFERIVGNEPTHVTIVFLGRLGADETLVGEIFDPRQDTRKVATVLIDVYLTFE